MMKRAPMALIAALLTAAPLAGAGPRAGERPATRTVTIDASVVDALGRFVPSLTKADFEVFDNGKPQTLTVFKSGVQPVTMVIMIDRSGSLVWNTTAVEDAAETFITTNLLPADRARIGSFSTEITIAPPAFTSDQAELIRALHASGQLAGPTPLWNATGTALDALAHESGRRAVLVFSYSKDAPDPSESNATLLQTKTRAEAEDVAVYAIGLGGALRLGPSPVLVRPALFQRGGRGTTGRAGNGPPNGPVGPNAVATPDPGLKTLAGDSGGDYVELEPTFGVADTFARVGDELHGGYVLAFETSAQDGKMHKLEVRVRRPDLIAHARKSYLAAPGAESPRAR